MLNSSDTALVLIDFQTRLCKHIHQNEKILSQIRMLINGLQVLEVPIIYTEQIPEKLGPTLEELSQILKPVDPIAKRTFSCCGEEDFICALRTLNRKNIVIAGIETHVCVYQTVSDLLDLSYKVHVVADCVSSRTEFNSQIGLEKMKAAGAQLTSVETLLCELLRIAQGEKFKSILRLIK